MILPDFKRSITREYIQYCCMTVSTDSPFPAMNWISRNDGSIFEKLKCFWQWSRKFFCAWVTFLAAWFWLKYSKKIEFGLDIREVRVGFSGGPIGPGWDIQADFGPRMIHTVLTRIQDFLGLPASTDYLFSNVEKNLINLVFAYVILIKRRWKHPF